MAGTMIHSQSRLDDATNDMPEDDTNNELNPKDDITHNATNPNRTRAATNPNPANDDGNISIDTNMKDNTTATTFDHLTTNDTHAMMAALLCISDTWIPIELAMLFTLNILHGTTPSL